MPVVRVRVRTTVRVRVRVADRVRVRVRVTVLGYIALGTCYSTPLLETSGVLRSIHILIGTYWKSIL